MTVSDIVLALHEVARWQNEAEIIYPEAGELQEVVDGVIRDHDRVIEVAENVREWLNEKNLTFSGHGRYLAEALDVYDTLMSAPS